MRKIIGGSIFLFVGLLFVAGTTMAGVGNLYPTGPHYNLNIIGKKAEFQCPAQEYDYTDPLNPIPVYGNVVFVAETGSDAQINMKSGSTKGKTAIEFTELKAIDPCAGFDGSPAIIQLPPNDNGYRVFARARGKPTDNLEPNTWSMSFTPGISWVQDETNTDLVYIGLVTSNGFESVSKEVTRLKGKPLTVPINEMFEWSGKVCYAGIPQDQEGNLLTAEYPLTWMCYLDNPNADGMLETYDINDAIANPIVADPNLPLDSSNLSCDVGTGILTQLYCHQYDDEQWVFNIADLVEYFWSVDTQGSKNVQIRFYPN